MARGLADDLRQKKGAADMPETIDGTLESASGPGIPPGLSGVAVSFLVGLRGMVSLPERLAGRTD